MEQDDRPGGWLREIWASTIGKKIVVAITGTFLALFVVGHMLGNLKSFEGNGGSGGEAKIDEYGRWLRNLGDPAVPHSGILWILRAVLLVSLILHVAAIVALKRRNDAARPTPAARIQRSLSSRTMVYSGFFLLAFIIFHILQFTTGTIQVTEINTGDIYENLDRAFGEWYLVLFYVTAVLLLGLHLHHAIWSATQTGGYDKPNRNRTIRRFATTVAAAVAIGFAAVPIAFWTDVVPGPAKSENVTANVGGR